MRSEAANLSYLVAVRWVVFRELVCRSVVRQRIKILSNDSISNWRCFEVQFLCLKVSVVVMSVPQSLNTCYRSKAATLIDASKNNTRPENLFSTFSASKIRKFKRNSGLRILINLFLNSEWVSVNHSLTITCEIFLNAVVSFE